MKPSFKKLLTLILTLCMVFSVFAVGGIVASAQNSDTIQITTPIEANGDSSYYFTPNKTARYTLKVTFTDNHKGYIRFFLYESDEDWEDLDYTVWGNSVSFVPYLQAGKRYRFKVSPAIEADYTVVLSKPATLKKLECVKNPYRYIEEDGRDGYFQLDKNYLGKEKRWFYYQPSHAVNEATFKATYSDGTTETLKGTDARLNPKDTQSAKNPWKKGGKNQITVTYRGKKATLSAKIKKSDIKSIKLADDNDFVFYEKNEISGYWQDDYESKKFYFRYDVEDLLSNCVFKLTYKNGKTKYITTNDNAFSEADVFHTQDYKHQWKKGGKNKVTINIQGAELVLNAKIVKNTLNKDFIYKIYGENLLSISKYVGNAKSGVKIPKKIGKYKVGYLEGEAFAETEYAKNKKNWINGALYIGDWLVYVETDAESFTVKEGTKYIAKYAFSGADNLKKLTIPASIEIINFNYCTDLEKITYKGSPERWASINDILYSEETVVKCTGKACKHDWKWKTDKVATKYVKGLKHKECSKCFQHKDGSEKKTIGIAKAKISGIKNKTYTGKALKQSLTLKIGKKVLKNGADYTVSYKNNKKVGTATVLIKGKGDYAGTLTKNFKITPIKTAIKKISASKKSLKVTISKKSKQVSGYQVAYSTSKSFKNAKTKTIKSYKTTSLTIGSLKATKTYYVRVRAFKSVNGKKVYSAWSGYKSKKTK